MKKNNKETKIQKRLSKVVNDLEKLAENESKEDIRNVLRSLHSIYAKIEDMQSLFAPLISIDSDAFSGDVLRDIDDAYASIFNSRAKIAEALKKTKVLLRNKNI